MTPAENISPTLTLEERQLALEEQKVEIEREKLKVERFKGWATGGSIVISLLIAALTIVFGVWSQHKQVMTQLEVQDKQAKSQFELEEKQAKSQFEIKAAEIVMNTDTPGVTQNKAKALSALFPETLPQNFAQSFDPNQYADKQQTVALDATNKTRRGKYPKKRSDTSSNSKSLSPPTSGGGGGGSRPRYRRPRTPWPG